MGALPEDRRPRVLLSASAIGYYGDRGDELLTEDAHPGSGFLADVCRAWEAQASVAERLGVRTVLLRTGGVLGRGGGALARLLPIFRLGLGGRVGPGTQWMSWIHLDDLIELWTFALDRSDVRGAVNAVAPHPVTNVDFTATLARVLERPAVVPAPTVALRLALGEMADVLLQSQRVVPRVAEIHGASFRHPDLGAALVDLARDPATTLVMEQWVPRPPEEVFAFFADAHNLERITPPFLKFRILGVSTPTLQTGTRIDYQLSLHGVPVRWQSLIRDWTPVRRFVDTQTRGPYHRWEHTHEFEPHDGGTVIRDRVQYELPIGALGAVVAGGFVANDLKKIFTYRRRVIQKIFG
jgi:ligand-binding SRPBCC domain-containing protein